MEVKRFFRRKRMFNNNNPWEKDIGRIIGVAGTSKGCGSTYISLMIANSLKRLGVKKIAWIDMGESGMSSLISAPADCLVTSYKKKDKEGGTGGCRYKGVDYYDYGGGDGLLEIINEPYDYIVIDFGNERDSPSKELLRCDIKILIGLSSPWKRILFERYISSNKELMKKGKWRYIFNLTSGENAKVFRKGYKIKAINVEYEDRFDEIGGNNFEKILALLLG